MCVGGGRMTPPIWVLLVLTSAHPRKRVDADTWSKQFEQRLKDHEEYHQQEYDAIEHDLNHDDLAAVKRDLEAVRRPQGGESPIPSHIGSLAQLRGADSSDPSPIIEAVPVQLPMDADPVSTLPPDDQMMEDFVSMGKLHDTVTKQKHDLSDTITKMDTDDAEEDKMDADSWNATMKQIFAPPPKDPVPLTVADPSKQSDTEGGDLLLDAEGDAALASI